MRASGSFAVDLMFVLGAEQLTFSSYKNHNTLKALIGTTPSLLYRIFTVEAYQIKRS